MRLRMSDAEFSLDSFEYHTLRGDFAEAAAQLVAGLSALEANHGRFPASSIGGSTDSEGDQRVLTRFAAAASSLLGAPEFSVPAELIDRLLYLQRWLAAVFSASPFGDSDHVLRAMAAGGPPVNDRFSIEAADMLRYCLAWTPQSRIPLALDAIWEARPALALSVAISAVAPRVVATPEAHARREAWLGWLTDRLDRTESLDGLPTGLLHHVYMNCSYADRADKHAIKGAITRLIRKVLVRAGITDNPRPLQLGEGRPVMLVLLEQWLPGHSVYRTHAGAIEGARGRFHTVAVGFERWVAPECRESFDEFVPLAEGPILEQLGFLRGLADERDAQVLHFPSIGMFPLTMFAAALRIAPVQTMSTGHPATTNSPAVDYLLVERDYLGNPSLWSETVLALAPDAVPYRASSTLPELVRTREDDPATVRIAICASVMKFNPRFLAACAEIRRRATRPVEFHFLPALADGVIYWQLRKAVEAYLGASAAIYPHLAYPQYMALLASCDLFANPFPFGNTNGIVDTVTAWLPGVCKTGPEVHEHIDEGLFGRIGFPDWTVARTVEDYVAAVVRLVDDPPLRETIRRDCCGPEKVAVLFGKGTGGLGTVLRTELDRRVSG